MSIWAKFCKTGKKYTKRPFSIYIDYLWIASIWQIFHLPGMPGNVCRKGRNVKCQNGLIFSIFPLLRCFSDVFWKYRFPGISWNFDPSCTHFLAFQEGENSVRYLQTIDNQYTRRTRFPDQPFGLGDSWSAGKLTPFQALFSRPAEFGPYALKWIYHEMKNFFCLIMYEMHFKANSNKLHEKAVPISTSFALGPLCL